MSPVSCYCSVSDCGVFLGASAAWLLWAVWPGVAVPCSWSHPTAATGSAAVASPGGDVFWPELGISVSHGIPASLRTAAEQLCCLITFEPFLALSPGIFNFSFFFCLPRIGIESRELCSSWRSFTCCSCFFQELSHHRTPVSRVGSRRMLLPSGTNTLLQLNVLLWIYVLV